jgi:transcriptional regulator of acetoin/glycerol metabolism
MEHAFVMCRGDMINPEHFPSHIRSKSGHMDQLPGLTLRDWEKQAILKTLEQNEWKIMKTARELDIDKNTLRRKIIRHGIIKN